VTTLAAASGGHAAGRVTRRSGGHAAGTASGRHATGVARHRSSN
jgi:hypothetical protein